MDYVHIMQPRITIERKWSDEDVHLLVFHVCDGESLFVSEAYTGLDWGTKSAEGLKTFSRQIHGGLFNLEAGTGGPEYASGAFRARFHWFHPTVLLITTAQQGSFFEFKDSQVAPEAKMFLRTEAALLDRFVLALPVLDEADDDAKVTLECFAAADV